MLEDSSVAVRNNDTKNSDCLIHGSRAGITVLFGVSKVLLMSDQTGFSRFTIDVKSLSN